MTLWTLIQVNVFDMIFPHDEHAPTASARPVINYGQKPLVGSRLEHKAGTSPDCSTPQKVLPHSAPSELRLVSLEKDIFLLHLLYYISNSGREVVRWHWLAVTVHLYIFLDIVFQSDAQASGISSSSSIYANFSFNVQKRSNNTKLCQIQVLKMRRMDHQPTKLDFL